MNFDPRGMQEVEIDGLGAFELLLLGKGIGYSRSPAFFGTLFKEQGILGRYSLLDVAKMPDLKQLTFQNPKLLGLNVTQPYKIAALEFMDTLSEASREIGAINTVVIKRVGESIILQGHNTDVIGFQEDCLGWVGSSEKKNALILGTGGASRAAQFSLQRNGWTVELVSRNPKPNVLTYRDLNQSLMQKFSLIVNATPVGQASDTHSLLLRAEDLSAHHFVYDMAYAQSLTDLLAAAKQAGAQVRNGEGMLKAQALASWALWKAELERQVA